MREFVLSIAALITFAAPAAAQDQTDACAHDANALLALDVETFDRTPGEGWRPVAETEGCEGAAADLIETYRGRMEEQLFGLMHHEAQLRAAAGETDAAIALLERVRAHETSPEMLAYRDATIAFLRNDRVALLAARDRLLSLPAPDGFEQSIARFRERYPDQTPPSWPLNIEVVEGFVACLGRPYREAYTEPCRGGLDEAG